MVARLDITEALLKRIRFDTLMTTTPSGETVISAAPAGAEYWVVKDARLTGFSIRVRPKNITFYMRGRIKHTRQQKDRPLGRWPVIDVKTARTMAMDAAIKFWSGLDPAIEWRENARRTLEHQARSAYTFAQAWDDWATRTSAKVSTSTVQDRTCARTWLVGSPIWSASLWDITGQVVEDTLSPLHEWAGGQGGRPGWGPRKMSWSVMHKIVAYLKPAYAFVAIDKKIITHKAQSPIIQWLATHAMPKDPARTRLLDHGSEEGQKWLKAIIGRYDAADAPKLLDRNDTFPGDKSRGKPTRKVMLDYALLLLLWGTRRAETRLLRVDDVMLDKGIVIFRGENTKSGKSYGVPITPWAERIIRARLRENELWRPGSPWLFPSRIHGKCIYDACKVFDDIGQETGVILTHHDLRRTMGTDIFRMGAQQDDVAKLLMVGAMLNHSGVDMGVVNPVSIGYIQKLAEIKRASLTKRENLLRQRAGLESLAINDQHTKATTLKDMIAADPVSALRVLTQLMATKLGQSAASRMIEGARAD